MCRAYVSIACADARCALSLRPAARASEWRLVIWSWCWHACKRGSDCVAPLVDWVAPDGAKDAASLLCAPELGEEKKEVQPAIWCEVCKKERRKCPHFTPILTYEQHPITWIHPHYQAAYQPSNGRIDGLDAVEIWGCLGDAKRCSRDSPEKWSQSLGLRSGESCHLCRVPRVQAAHSLITSPLALLSCTRSERTFTHIYLQARRRRASTPPTQPPPSASHLAPSALERA